MSHRTDRAWRRNEILIVFAGWAAVGAFTAGTVLLRAAAFGEPMTIVHAISVSAADSLSWALATLVALWASRRYPLERQRLFHRLLLHLALGAALSLVRSAALHIFYQSTGWYPPRTWEQALYSLGPSTLVIYLALLGIGHAVNYAHAMREREIRSTQLEGQLARAQLQMLKMQIHPHFLFNTLHAISTLVHRDSEAAERMIANLSELLRSSLAHQQLQEVSVAEELALLERYLDIERTRFRDRLRLDTHIAPDTLHARLPHLILQPLVENAIRHGIAPQRDGGRVEISTERVDGELRIRVRDDGRGFPKRQATGPATGVGLSNVRSRLQQLYGGAQNLSVVSAPDEGTLVEIVIPFRAAERPSAPVPARGA